MSEHVKELKPRVKIKNILTFESGGDHESVVRRVFEEYGTVKKVKLINNRFFVTFENPADAEDAYSNLSPFFAVKHVYKKARTRHRRRKQCEPSRGEGDWKEEEKRDNSGSDEQEYEWTAPPPESTTHVVGDSSESDLSVNSSSLTDCGASGNSNGNIAQRVNGDRVLLQRNQSPEGVANSPKSSELGCEQPETPKDAVPGTAGFDTPLSEDLRWDTLPAPQDIACVLF